MKAVCLGCKGVVDSSYETLSGQKILKRLCTMCGETESVVSKSAALHDEAMELVGSHGNTLPGLIVEVLDGCNIECPTCIAASFVGAGNIRTVESIRANIALASKEGFSAVLLSGGEPTIHPRLFEIMDVVSETGVTRKVVITNGLRLSRDARFAKDFVKKLRDGWEVFLQFDGLDERTLVDLRGADYSADRMRALAALDESDVRTTLVSIAKRGVNLSSLTTSFELAHLYPCVVGLQFQPIRNAGRALRYVSDENSSDVVDVIEAIAGIGRFSHHPSSPLVAKIGHWDRSSEAWLNRPDLSAERGFYIEETRLPPSNRVRISILDYSDIWNWTSLRSETCALSVLQKDGTTASVDDHFLGLANY